MVYISTAMWQVIPSLSIMRAEGDSFDVSCVLNYNMSCIYMYNSHKSVYNYHHDGIIV